MLVDDVELAIGLQLVALDWENSPLVQEQHDFLNQFTCPMMI